MTKDTGFFTCKNICWIIGALFGFALYLMISGIIGLIIGIVVAIGLAIFLQKTFCGDVTSTAVREIAQAGDDVAPDERGSDEVAASAASIPAAAMDGAPVPVEAATAPAAPAKKTDAKPADKKPADKKPAAKKTGSDTPAAKKATPKDPATKAAKPAAAAPTGQPNKPHTMDAPRASGADDLKQLKGVGPKLEQTLNGLGFWHFDQIAQWGPDEIAWVDDNLSFKGRIERDGWIEQAKTLAEGGETAFSKKVKKGDVY